MKNDLRILIVAFLFLFAFVSISFSSEKQGIASLTDDPMEFYTSIPSQNYNKPFSILLSLVSPGMGQIYSGQLGKGLSIWSGATVLFAGFLLNASTLDFTSVGGLFPYNFGFSFNKDLSGDALFWTIGFGVSYLVLYIYNIIDISVYDARTTFVSFDFDDKNVSAYYCIRF
jgi:hypothetical protein